MAKQNYDVLEEQIGEMGGEPQTTSIGKLKHKESYGGKSELSDQEQADMNEFLARSNKHKKEEISAPISDGWIPINRDAGFFDFLSSSSSFSEQQRLATSGEKGRMS